MDTISLPGSKTGQDWHKKNCYGCGPENPHGLHADFQFHEPSGEVRFDYTPLPYLEGAPGFMHGGALASILDEAQGVLCFHVGHPVMTEQLHMKYHKATSLHKTFHVRAWLTSVRKRRIYTRATIHSSEGELLVSSSASWYAFPDRLMKRMFSDSESKAKEEQIAEILEANRKRAKLIRRRLRAEKRSTT